jgi:hypothetical protein
MHINSILQSLRKHEKTTNCGLKKKTLANLESIRFRTGTDVRLVDYLRLPCEIDADLARYICDRGAFYFEGEMIMPRENGDGLLPYNIGIMQSGIVEVTNSCGTELHITLKAFGQQIFFLGILPRFICHI